MEHVSNFWFILFIYRMMFVICTHSLAFVLFHFVGVPALLQLDRSSGGIVHTNRSMNPLYPISISVHHAFHSNYAQSALN